MITVSDLVDLNQIRAVLTVSPADLPDSVLQGFGLEDELEDVLDSKLPSWSETDNPKHQRKLRLFSKYKCAASIALMAPVFILKKMTDGSNEGQRMDKDGLRWLAEELQGKADALMDELLDDLGQQRTVTAIDLVGVSTPQRDPITEPRPENN